MPRRIYDFRVPDRFVAGTIGEPGQRTFYLQAQKGPAIVSVALEKVQVVVLAQRIAELLAEMGRRGVVVSAGASAGEGDQAALTEPVVESFRVGTMTLAWDGDSDHVVVEARAEVETGEHEGAEEPEVADEPEGIDDLDPDGPDLVRVRLAPGRARAFAERALEVATAGRPPCPLCGRPLDPGGHVCPRRNGYVH